MPRMPILSRYGWNSWRKVKKIQQTPSQMLTYSTLLFLSSLEGSNQNLGSEILLNANPTAKRLLTKQGVKEKSWRVGCQPE